MTRIALWVRFAKYITKQESIAGLCDRPTVVSSFHEQPPRYTQSTDAALCGCCEIGNTADTEHKTSQFAYYRMGLVEEMGPTDQSYQVQMPHNLA